MGKTLVYRAAAMTGRSGRELVRESRKHNRLAKVYGLTLLYPVLEEGVSKYDAVVGAPEDKLVYLWARDKEMIRQAHVLLDVSGPSKSEGVAHEIGYARYYLWKPVVRVWPKLGPGVARIEDDEIAPSVEYAMALIRLRWGTPWKRFWWRFGILRKAIPRFVARQTREILNCWR